MTVARSRRAGVEAESECFFFASPGGESPGKTTEHPYSYYVPGYTTQQPVTSYSNASANFYGSGGFSGYGTAYGTSTSYVPVYHEGYSAQGVIFRTQIDAYMIRLK